MKLRTYLIFGSVISAILATTVATAVTAEDKGCYAAAICPVGSAPTTVMHGTPLWQDIPLKPPVSEAPTKPLEAVKPQAVVATENLDKPHKDLTGADLIKYNQFCRSQDPKKVWEWRYNTCNELDPAFAK